MKGIIALLLCICLVLSSCKTHEPQQASLIRQPNWWERRMDRLETWNRRHGYPVDKAKTVALYTLVTTGFVASIAATCLLNNEQKNQPGQSPPFAEPTWYFSF